MLALLVAGAFMLTKCGTTDSTNGGALKSDMASRSFVPPGQLDEFYAFISGGFSGQLSVYGLPSGRKGTGFENPGRPWFHPDGFSSARSGCGPPPATSIVVFLSFFQR